MSDPTDRQPASIMFSVLPSRLILKLLGSSRLPQRWWTPLVCVLARRGLVEHVELVDDDGRRW